MATAVKTKVPSTEDPHEGDHCQILFSVADKFLLVAKEIDRRRNQIWRYQVTLGVTGTAAVIGSFYTAGASLAAAGAISTVLLMWLADLVSKILEKRELRNFDQEWKTTKSQIKLNRINCDIPLRSLDQFANWAKTNLDKDAADAILTLLTKSASNDPGSAKRLQALNEGQVALLLDSLASIVLADLSILEVVSGSVTTKRSDAAAHLRNLGNEIRKYAEEQREELERQQREVYKRQKEELELQKKKQQEEKQRREQELQKKKREEIQKKVDKLLSGMEQKLKSVDCKQATDQSFPSYYELSLSQKGRGTSPIFSPKWQGDVTLYSTRSSTLQLPNSEVILYVPPGAVPIEKAHVQAAVCTDIDYIRNILRLEDEEEIISPLVEYKTTESFRFQKPVSITLPHFHLGKYDSDLMYVYHVVIKEDHSIEKRRVSATPASKLFKEGSAERDQYPHFMATSPDRIIVKTNSFSAYFLCKYCRKETRATPDLYAAVSGKFETEKVVTTQARIWDKRLKIKDFRKEVGIDLDQDKVWPLTLLNHIQGSQLHISVRTGPGETLMLDRDGNELTPRKKVFELPHELVCEGCLKRGKFNPLPMEWMFHTTQTQTAVPLSVSLSIDVQHCLLSRQAANSYSQRQTASTSIPYVVKGEVAAGDNVAAVILQELEQMHPAQRAQVACEIRVSVSQIDHLIRSRDFTGVDQSDLLRAVLNTVRRRDRSYSAVRGGFDDASGAAPNPTNHSSSFSRPNSYSRGFFRRPEQVLTGPQLSPGVYCEQDIMDDAFRTVDIRRDDRSVNRRPPPPSVVGLQDGPVAQRDSIPPELRLDSLKL